MGRELLILRHAKSDQGASFSTDFERPLAKRGNRDAPRMGRWMHEQGLSPDYVISSPAKRAVQTTRKVCLELGVDEGGVCWEERIYDAGLGDLLGVLGACPRESGRVLMVGHNPGLEQLLAYLSGDAQPVSGEGKSLPTAALARLTMPDDWSSLAPGVAGLVAIVRPRSL